MFVFLFFSWPHWYVTSTINYKTDPVSLLNSVIQIFLTTRSLWDFFRVSERGKNMHFRSMTKKRDSYVFWWSTRLRFLYNIFISNRGNEISNEKLWFIHVGFIEAHHQAFTMATQALVLLAQVFLARFVVMANVEPSKVKQLRRKLLHLPLTNLIDFCRDTKNLSIYCGTGHFCREKQPTSSIQAAKALPNAYCNDYY